MKKLVFIALLCCVGVMAKSQSLRLIGTNPGYLNDPSYASHPIITLDSLTGYLHYSFTVNYPTGAEWSNIDWGGTLISIGIVYGTYDTVENLLTFDNETSDYTTLPSGQVVHSGSIYIGNRFSTLNQVAISASTGFIYNGMPNQLEGYSTYDEYEFIP